jgi:hypothetical protein
MKATPSAKTSPSFCGSGWSEEVVSSRPSGITAADAATTNGKRDVCFIRFPVDLVVTVADFQSCGWEQVLSGKASERYWSMSQALADTARAATEASAYARANVLWLLADATSMRLTPGSANLGFPQFDGGVTQYKSRGAQQGVLIRDAEALERMEKVDTVVVDKTGTLTEGHPKVVHIEAAAGFNSDDVLAKLASVERASEHPLAMAVVNRVRVSMLFRTSKFAAMKEACASVILAFNRSVNVVSVAACGTETYDASASSALMYADSIGFMVDFLA